MACLSPCPFPAIPFLPVFFPLSPLSVPLGASVLRPPHPIYRTTRLSHCSNGVFLSCLLSLPCVSFPHSVRFRRFPRLSSPRRCLGLFATKKSSGPSSLLVSKARGRFVSASFNCRVSAEIFFLSGSPSTPFRRLQSFLFRLYSISPNNLPKHFPCRFNGRPFTFSPAFSPFLSLSRCSLHLSRE